MNQKNVLEAIRKYSLWAFIGSSVVLMVLLILWAWGVFNLTNTDSMMDYLNSYYPDPSVGLADLFSFTAWAKIMLTLSAIASTAMSILLALLIAKFAKMKGK